MENLVTSKTPGVLIIDDEETTRELLRAFYEKSNYSVETFASATEALKRLESSEAKNQFDLVVSDLMMPEMDGLELVDRVSKITHKLPVILVTGHGSVESAVEGMSKGAFDYVTKPINFSELSVISDRAIRIRRLEESYRQMKKKIATPYELEEILGKSAPIQKVFDAIKRLSQITCNVLITGESGTGKDLVARAIHARSSRAKKPFVAINCSAIPDTLLESELFGHAKGAFTGATERRRGLLEEAHEGTIFLDEIGDMPLPLQAKLLRFLQEKKVKPVGDNVYRTTDVRVIAATHTNLKEAVKNKKFREDLYFRLCVVPIEIAPLRQRKEDIILLSEHFLEKFAEKFNSKAIGFTKAALSKLTRLPWPGNVRELENTIERAVVFCENALVDEQDIQVTEISEEDSCVVELFSRLRNLRELEKEYIEYVLLQTNNRRERTAEVLGINRKTLYRKQKEYGIRLTK